MLSFKWQKAIRMGVCVSLKLEYYSEKVVHLRCTLLSAQCTRHSAYNGMVHIL